MFCVALLYRQSTLCNKVLALLETKSLFILNCRNLLTVHFFEVAFSFFFHLCLTCIFVTAILISTERIINFWLVSVFGL